MIRKLLSRQYSAFVSFSCFTGIPVDKSPVAARPSFHARFYFRPAREKSPLYRFHNLFVIQLSSSHFFFMFHVRFPSSSSALNKHHGYSASLREYRSDLFLCPHRNSPGPTPNFRPRFWLPQVLEQVAKAGGPENVTERHVHAFSIHGCNKHGGLPLAGQFLIPQVFARNHVRKNSMRRIS
jgi:hypothetical protein